MNHSTGNGDVSVPESVNSIPPYSFEGTAIEPTKDHEALIGIERASQTEELASSQGSTGNAIGRDDGGLVELDFGGHAGDLADSLMPQIREQSTSSSGRSSFPPSYMASQTIPKLNVVIQIVGTRGDVQPFIALGHSLQKHGHRVRLATHPVFKNFVEDEGLEFFSISGDPERMMAFMVKNPSLTPSKEAIKEGEISNRRREIEGILEGCWRSCIEGGDGMSQGAKEADAPFIADAIIANPPSFAHVHLAERLGIPLHMMFTMPWQPTEQFPHPLAKVNSKEKDQAKANRVSYFMMEMMQWQGLGDIINNFREKSLELDSMGPIWASTIFQRLQIPFTYCWSPALIPKPSDWGPHTSVAGFFFMDQNPTDYSPPPDLAKFLGSGSTPIYIGFGSIVIDDPKALTKIIFEAVQKTGVRAIVSRGSAGLGDGFDVPRDIFLLGDCPHSWLFNQVSAVMHHGGAGTTAAGIATGNPTIIVPFFGDQHFWGKMIARAGAGAEPIDYKDINVEKLVESIRFVLLSSTREAAADFKARIDAEDGLSAGTDYFHQELPLGKISCDMFPERPAVWICKNKAEEVKLSAVSAALLIKEGLLRPVDLILYRGKEYEVDPGPWDPITGQLSVTLNHIQNVAIGWGNVTWGLASKTMHAKKRDELTPSGKNNIILTAATSYANPNQSSMTPQGTTASLTSTPLQEASGEQSAMPSRANSLSTEIDNEGEILPLHASTSSPDRTSRGFKNLARGAAHARVASTVAVSQGLHNLPRLYGDTTVRAEDKITGIQSGLRAAGRAPVLGIYDGLSGLVTQPMQGAKEEGVLGFVKGVGKGFGGLVIKPIAGVHGIMGSLSKGIWKEARRRGPKEARSRIRSARLEQGARGLLLLGQEEKQRILEEWKQKVG